MSYMTYCYPNQPVYSAAPMSTQSRGGACYGASNVNMNMMPYTMQQIPQTMQATPQMMQATPQMAQPVSTPPPVASGNVMTPSGMVLPGGLGEQSYIENILRLNLGKVGTFYMTYENNSEWNAKVFRGVLEAAGRDHIIISDPMTGQRIMLLMVNFDYATFDEPLNYQYPYAPTPRTED